MNDCWGLQAPQILEEREGGREGGMGREREGGRERERQEDACKQHT